MKTEQSCYGWSNDRPTCAHEYLLPTTLKIVRAISNNNSIKILDLGCGNGNLSSRLAEQGHVVVGTDISSDGIEIARKSFSGATYFVCSIYDDFLIDKVREQVDCVVSLEVVEHLFHPKKLFEQSYSLLASGGFLIVSTPYHGYLKNLALSLLNGWDRHFCVDWDGGHIKFFSKHTLAQMAANAGFRNPSFRGVGRVPGLWKSIIMLAQK